MNSELSPRGVMELGCLSVEGRTWVAVGWFLSIPGAFCLLPGEGIQVLLGGRRGHTATASQRREI